MFAAIRRRVVPEHVRLPGFVLVSVAVTRLAYFCAITLPCSVTLMRPRSEPHGNGRISAQTID